jgi:hypothetical protein
MDTAEIVEILRATSDALETVPEDMWENYNDQSQDYWPHTKERRGSGIKYETCSFCIFSTVFATASSCSHQTVGIFTY